MTENEIRLSQIDINIGLLQEEKVKVEREIEDEEVTYSIGDRFEDQVGSKAILCGVDSCTAKMIMLATGSGLANIAVGNFWNITQSEFLKYTEAGFIRYWDDKRKIRIETP